jgi:hypothetical protein
MLRFRELEHTTLYAGLGVRLVDEYTQGPPLGRCEVLLDIDEGTGWRQLDPRIVRRVATPCGILWFPWRERVRDARGLPPRRYRVRVVADYYTPGYLYDAEGIEAPVDPYDDVTPPANTPPPIEITLLPNASYPFDPGLPVLRGAVEDIYGDRVPYARVSWIDPTVPPALPLVTDLVLSDDDGEFSLPMRRAPLLTQIDIHARRPPPPLPGKFRIRPVQLPDDLSTFLTMTIL